MTNLMPGEGYGIPDDLYAKRAERKRKLAEALKRDSLMPQGQMVSGHFVAPSITQYLASGLKGYQANQLDRQSDKEEETGAMQKQKRLADAQQKYLDALRPQQVQTGETKQPFEASQMDRFGAPQQGQVQATQPVMGQRQPTPQEMYAAQMQYAADLQDPQALMQAANQNIGYRVKQDDKQDEREYSDKIYNRGRADKLSDVDAERKYQDIVRKDTQDLQVSQQDRQFAQQFQMQKQSQNFAAGQQSRSQSFQAGENQKSRDATAALKKGETGINWKYDAQSDEFVAPPTPDFPMGRRSGNIAKNNAGKSMDYVIGQFRGQYDDKGQPLKDAKGNPLELGALNKTTQGGIMGVSGAIGKLTDSQDQRRFDNLKEQMSTELRTLFRIPGEGTLSDKEQAQYGIQLPSVYNSKETNEKILKDVETRIKLRNNGNANPLLSNGNSNVRTVDW